MARSQTSHRYSGFFAVGTVVYLVFGLLTAILAARFLLTLLGINRDNAIVAFIYDVSAPLVAPFQGIFNLQATYGSPRFEIETLVALIVFALIGGLLSSLLRRPRE